MSDVSATLPLKTSATALASSVAKQLSEGSAVRSDPTMVQSWPVQPVSMPALKHLPSMSVPKSSTGKASSLGSKTTSPVKKSKAKHKHKPKTHKPLVKSTVVVSSEPPAQLLGLPVAQPPLSISSSSEGDQDCASHSSSVESSVESRLSLVPGFLFLWPYLLTALRI